jgi:predicted transcriptional regulator
MTKVKIVPVIKDKGYPTTHEKYPYCHKLANMVEKKKFGKVYVQRHKKGTLLGSYDKDGKVILVSEIVPKKKRNRIIIHEKAELECMKRL